MPRAIAELKAEVADYCGGFVLPSGARPFDELCAEYEAENRRLRAALTRIKALDGPHGGKTITHDDDTCVYCVASHALKLLTKRGRKQ